jgi:formylglycine-generating enzyme required for sulfatase activity
MRPHPQAGQSIGTVRALVASVGLFLAADNPGHGQSAAPRSAPADTSMPVSAPDPVPAPPLTKAQQAILIGKMAGFVSQLATETGIRLVPIPAGSFIMGSPADEPGRAYDETPHKVTLTKDFYLGATVVSLAQSTLVLTWASALPSRLRRRTRTPTQHE